MRFQVPQFIEIEDKVIGPLSFKQFVYIAGAVGLAFLLYVFLPKIFAIPLGLGALALGGSLAFYKINNKPFVHFLESWFRYITTAKLYIWKKVPKKPEPGAQETQGASNLYMPKLSDSKLKDLAWSLDVQDKAAEDSSSTSR